MASLCCFTVPLHCFRIVLGYAIAVLVHNAQIVHTRCKASLCCFTVPLHCFRIVLGYAIAVSVHIAQIVHTTCMASHCCFTVPLHCFRIVMGYAIALLVHIAQIVHTSSKASLCCFTVPLHCFRIVFGYAIAVMIHSPHIVHTICMASLCCFAIPHRRLGIILLNATPKRIILASFIHLISTERGLLRPLSSIPETQFPKRSKHSRSSVSFTILQHLLRLHIVRLIHTLSGITIIPCCGKGLRSPVIIPALHQLHCPVVLGDLLPNGGKHIRRLRRCSLHRHRPHRLRNRPVSTLRSHAPANSAAFLPLQHPLQLRNHTAVAMHIIPGILDMLLPAADARQARRHLAHMSLKPNKVNLQAPVIPSPGEEAHDLRGQKLLAQRIVIIDDNDHHPGRGQCGVDMRLVMGHRHVAQRTEGGKTEHPAGIQPVVELAGKGAAGAVRIVSPVMPRHKNLEPVLFLADTVLNFQQQGVQLVHRLRRPLRHLHQSQLLICLTLADPVIRQGKPPKGRHKQIGTPCGNGGIQLLPHIIHAIAAQQGIPQVKTPAVFIRRQTGGLHQFFFGLGILLRFGKGVGLRRQLISVIRLAANSLLSRLLPAYRAIGHPALSGQVQFAGQARASRGGAVGHDWISLACMIVWRRIPPIRIRQDQYSTPFFSLQQKV